MQGYLYKYILIGSGLVSKISVSNPSDWLMTKKVNMYIHALGSWSGEGRVRERRRRRDIRAEHLVEVSANTGQ